MAICKTIWDIKKGNNLYYDAKYHWGQEDLIYELCYKMGSRGDYPGGPVVKTSPSNARGAASIPGWGAKIPHASRPKNQNIKPKQYCNKLNKDFKIGPHQKIS